MRRSGLLVMISVLVIFAVSCQPSTEALYQEAKELEDKGAVDQAIEKYYEIINKHPEEANGHFRLAVLLSSKGELDKAVAHYTQVTKLEPQNLDAHLNFSGYYYKRKNYYLAVKELQKVLEISPNSPAAEIARSLAVKVERTMVREAFIQKAEKEFALHPEKEDLRQKLANAYSEEAQEFTSNRNFSEALAKLQKAIDYRPKSSELYYTLAQLHDMMGKKEDAIKALDQSIQLDPKNMQYRFSRAGYLIQLGRQDEGRSELNSIIAMDPISLEAEFAKKRLDEMEREKK
jgi:tetratricopeptide (TPR) repeat protein